MTAKLQWVAATPTAPKIRDGLVTAEDIRPASTGSRQHLRQGHFRTFLNGQVGRNQEGRPDDKASESNGATRALSVAKRMYIL
jgi:hypothetical protein